MTLAQQLLAAAAIAGRVCLGLVFLAAAAQKMRHWKILPGVIADYRLLPAALATPLALLLPPLELMAALALLGLAPVLGAALALALLALFAAAMAINLRRGRGHIDCGCGGDFLRQELRWALVGRNALLALLLLPVLAPAAPASLPLLAAGAAAGLAFLLLYFVAGVLSALPRPA